jgi:NAD(P)-dependent dehydrogenase (short-subunit alcohol dehydrogenase family)
MNSLNRFSLKSKNVLITGAGGALGVEHAAAILECYGNVILTDIDESLLTLAENNLKRNFPDGNIDSFIMDVTNENSISNVKNQIINSNRRIDVLINNAALNPKVSDKNLENISRLENFSLNTWNREIEVGLTGAFLCSKIIGGSMADDNYGGVILNIASDLSQISPYQKLYEIDGLEWNQQPVKPISYSVIKAGLIGLTRYLSTYWTDRNIRCNALSPGGVYIDQDQSFVSKISELIPMGRMAHIDEYRSSIQFLCSDASSYMNGQNIIIDGGRSAW